MKGREREGEREREREWVCVCVRVSVYANFLVGRWHPHLKAKLLRSTVSNSEYTV